MNERIRELAEQARRDSFRRIENPQDPTEWSKYHDTFEEKFAELIVQDICKLIHDNEFKLLPQHMHRMSAYAEEQMIKKYFGFE